MAIIGTMTVHYYGRVGTLPRTIKNVPKSQYDDLDEELMSNAGYHTFQVTTSTGGQTTLDKRGIASVDFEPTGDDGKPEKRQPEQGLTYHHPRRHR